MCTKNHNQVQFLRYGVTQFFLLFRTIFCLLLLSLTPQKTKILKKWKKASGVVIIFNLCNKNTIKSCMLTKIWSVTDIIICHFRSFFALLSHYWPGKLKFGKMLKTSAGIILLRMCTINQGHMMYGSWDIKCKGQSFFCHFRPFILPSDPLSNWKNQNFEKIKKLPGDIIVLHVCTTNDNHELWHLIYQAEYISTDRIFLSFWEFFALLPH